MSSIECNAWFANLPDAQREQLVELRRLVMALGEGIVEEFKWSRPCYSNNAGPFCYLHSTKHHATLGFERGTSLADPELLLEGEGKNMRHVKLEPSAGINTEALMLLLRQAYGQHVPTL